MPKIDLKLRSTQPAIGSMRQRVVVCTTTERPDEDVSTIVERPGVMPVMSRIRPLRGDDAVMLDWRAVFGKENTPTHEITIRCPPDVKVDLNHWVYHSDELGATWYKVRSVEDLGGVHRFLVLLCTLTTVNDARSDPATQSPPPTWENPTPDVI
jgi:hypothetical protein